MGHRTVETPSPTCPHCGHEMDTEEMLSAKGEDLFALAPNEGSAELTCPRCGKEYEVKGGYTPHYTSAASFDDF